MTDILLWCILASVSFFGFAILEMLRGTHVRMIILNDSLQELKRQNETFKAMCDCLENLVEILESLKGGR